MKIISFVTVAALCAITFFSACKNEGDAARDAAVDSIKGPLPEGDTSAMAPVTNANPATPTTTEPAQNAAGVWHYTCPKGCAGGAGTAAACAKCGTTLTHNTAYHPAPSSAPSPAPATTATPTAAPGITPVPAPATKAPEPAQNAAGVWHYTCSSGCAGGAGSAVACAKCGKTLAHNAVYHQ